MANPQQKDASKAKVKRPTSAKRQLQNEKKRLRNKAARSRVKSSVKSVVANIPNKDHEQTAASLSEMYSLVDKAVKNGVFKKNKGSRIKARLTARFMAKKAA